MLHIVELEYIISDSMLLIGWKPAEFLGVKFFKTPRFQFCVDKLKTNSVPPRQSKKAHMPHKDFVFI